MFNSKKHKQFLILMVFWIGFIACNQIESDRKEGFTPSISPEEKVKQKPQNILPKNNEREEEISNVKLPFGVEALIKTNFTKMWVRNLAVGIPDTNRRNEEFYSVMNEVKLDYAKRKTKSDSLMKTERKDFIYSYTEKDEYVNYYDDLRYVFQENLKGATVYREVERFYKRGLKNVVLFDGEKYKPEQPPARYSYEYSRADLVTFDIKGNEIDGLVFSFKAGRGEIFSYTRYSFIDENFIIHCKDFSLDEKYYYPERYEKWQIDKSGHFIRFFDLKEGAYKDEDEWGQIQDHTKEGKWIELKTDEFAKKGLEYKVYVEAYYKNGINSGTWNHCEPVYDFDSNLIRIRDSLKKGKLIYSDSYLSNGRLSERTYNKKSK